MQFHLVRPASPAPRTRWHADRRSGRLDPVLLPARCFRAGFCRGPSRTARGNRSGGTHACLFLGPRILGIRRGGRRLRLARRSLGRRSTRVWVAACRLAPRGTAMALRPRALVPPALSHFAPRGRSTSDRGAAVGPRILALHRPQKDGTRTCKCRLEPVKQEHRELASPAAGCVSRLLHVTGPLQLDGGSAFAAPRRRCGSRWWARKRQRRGGRQFRRSELRPWKWVARQ
jgi:hypothetical protein